MDIRMKQRRLWATLALTCLLAVTLSYNCVAQAAVELGIDRSKLSSESETVQEKTFEDIRALHATWFRDSPTSGSPKGVSNFVNEIRLAKQHNLKVLVNILQLDEDYDAELPKNRCGWHDKKLSAIKLDKYATRLRTLFGAIKDAHLTIDAVEFGNEDDTFCYDGDVPDGHAASPAELLTWLLGYGQFLKTGAEVLHDSRYFPQAKIITFGIAHGSDQWDKPPHHLSKPAQAVAKLRDVKGFNYLDNSEYHVDGYGTHIYAQSDIEAVISDRLHEDMSFLGRDKPLWVTEWGFADPKAFPNKNGKNMNEGLEEALECYEKLSREIPLGPLMFYRYDVWLADEPGRLKPLASALGAHFAKR
jgi:hypothetical protein